MLTLKDVVDRDGVCWRFIGADAPDTRPTVNSFHEPSPTVYPETWDWWNLHEKLGPYFKKHQDQRVELLEHWSKHPTPTLLKGTSELLVVRNENDETLEDLLACRVGGMRGDVALCHYEMAQRTESLCRVADGFGFVSTHGDYPLTVDQASFAREIWELKIRVLRQEAAEKERQRVVCDDVDEMPNMADG